MEGLSLNFQFVTYDDIFEETDISFFDTAVASIAAAACGRGGSPHLTMSGIAS